MTRAENQKRYAKTEKGRATTTRSKQTENYKAYMRDYLSEYNKLPERKPKLAAKLNRWRNETLQGQMYVAASNKLRLARHQDILSCSFFPALLHKSKYSCNQCGLSYRQGH